MSNELDDAMYNDTWTKVARRPARAPASQSAAAPVADRHVPHEGLRRRYLNLVAKHLEKSGPCDLGSLGSLLPQPVELRGKKLKDILSEANDVFCLDNIKDTGWSVRLKQGGKSAASLAPSGGHVKQLEKTRLCVQWQIQGGCDHGATCWFAHGAEELKSVTACMSTKHAEGPTKEPDRDQIPRRILPAACSSAPMPVFSLGGQFNALSLEDAGSDPPATNTQEIKTLQPKANEKQLWCQLDEAEQAAAMRLGYDQYYWEHGLAPIVCNFPWNQLASDERAAACLLGYCDQTWDNELKKAATLTVTTLTETTSLLDDSQDSASRDEMRSSSSFDPGSTHLSCKAKADAIRLELGFDMDLPMPAVVEKGFALIGDEAPTGGLVPQICALYNLLFE